MTKEKDDLYLKPYNVLTRPTALRNNVPWTAEEEATLVRLWPKDARNRVQERMRVARHLERTLIACCRHMTLMRKRERGAIGVDN